MYFVRHRQTLYGFIQVRTPPRTHRTGALMPKPTPYHFPNGAAFGVLLTSLVVRRFGGGEAAFDFLVVLAVLWAAVSLLREALAWRNR